MNKTNEVYCKKIEIDQHRYWIMLSNISGTYLNFMIWDESMYKIVWHVEDVPRGRWNLKETSGLDQAIIEVFDFWYSSIRDDATIHKTTILNNRKDA